MCQPRGEPFELGEPFPDLAQRLVQHVGDRGRRVEGHFLVQVTEIGGPGDAARVRFVGAGEKPEHRRLADPVLPDQPDAVAGGRGQGEAVDDPAGTEGPDDVACEQGCGYVGHGYDLA